MQRKNWICVYSKSLQYLSGFPLDHYSDVSCALALHLYRWSSTSWHKSQWTSSKLHLQWHFTVSFEKLWLDLLSGQNPLQTSNCLQDYMNMCVESSSHQWEFISSASDDFQNLWLLERKCIGSHRRSVRKYQGRAVWRTGLSLIAEANVSSVRDTAVSDYQLAVLSVHRSQQKRQRLVWNHDRCLPFILLRA